jgi:hypothetical protein
MLFALLGLTLAGTSPDASPEGPPTEGNAVHAGLRTGNAGHGVQLGYRHRTRRRFAFGLDAESVYLLDAYIGGFAVERDLRIAARVPLQFAVHDGPRLTMALTTAPGVRWTRSFDDAAPERTSIGITADFGAFAYLHQPRFSWMAGIDNSASVQVVPIRDVDLWANLLTTGPIVPVTEHLHWFATIEAGGAFGSNGDAGKFFLRGTTGLRGFFGPAGSSWRAFY